MGAPWEHRLVCPADGNHDVNPCVRIRTGRHNCIEAIGKERNLTKQITRMGSLTRMPADSDYREKNHTRGHSRAMMTPKNKGGDADKNVIEEVLKLTGTASNDLRMQGRTDPSVPQKYR